MKSYYYLDKSKKRFIAALSDATSIAIAWFGATWLTEIMDMDIMVSSYLVVPVVFMQFTVFLLCGLYRGIWRFASIPDLIRIIRSVIIGAGCIFIFYMFNNIELSIKFYIIYTLLLIMQLSGSRLVVRYYRDFNKFLFQGKRVLIVGAGNAGEGIIRDLQRSVSTYNYLPVAIVDDDRNQQGCDLHGVRVVGSCHEIPYVVKEYKIDLVLIAIPSANSKRMREIVQYCEDAEIPFRTLPSLKQIADGMINSNALREVLLEDLLGREQVYLDWNAIRHAIDNKVILVTGGGGSIGAELCRQISKLSPKKIIIVDNNEFNLYMIDKEMRDVLDQSQLFTCLCSITDTKAIEAIISLHKPDIVFHVAAYKHVPLLETNIRVAVFNNIIGTKTIAELSNKYAVKSFVLISTDKAVNPSSIMGVTKRASEIFCQTYNMCSSTQFITVRFGNVLESAGSVIPLFRSQLLKGGPLTVTHHQMTRYFMTIPEASQLILQAMTIDQDGHIFVLDMGEPINIRYLAEQLIKLSGKVVGHDIEIIYTGLRPGEKLYEELFHENENICETIHPKIKQAKVREYDWNFLQALIRQLEEACQTGDEDTLKQLLCLLVPEYRNALDINAPEEINKDKIYTDYSLSTIQS